MSKCDDVEARPSRKLLDVEDVERKLWHNASPTSSHRQQHTDSMSPTSPLVRFARPAATCLD
jgi:hypothetical protein